MVNSRKIDAVDAFHTRRPDNSAGFLYIPKHTFIESVRDRLVRSSPQPYKHCENGKMTYVAVVVVVGREEANTCCCNVA